MTSTKRLTPAQRKFLAGYLPDILHGDNADLGDVPRAEFVQRVTGMDFDDSDVATLGMRRVATRLADTGFISALDIHPDVAGQPHIYLLFTETGANALFEINAKGITS